MSYRIVTDSACNLPDELIDELDLTILPLIFMIDGKEHLGYEKGKPFDLKGFYGGMRSGMVATTSLPPMELSLETIKAILDAGEDVLYLGFSSGLSGTFQSVKTVCEPLKADYPDRTIICVETLAAALGEGLLVYYAAKRAAAGASIQEVATWVEQNRLKLAHWFTVDDLIYLYRGGRVSRTSAWAGNLLNIKPVLHVDDEGKLVPMEKARGRKKSIKALVDHMAATADAPVAEQEIFISHGDCPEDAEYLQKLITERFGCTKFLVHYLDPVIGAHSGPGTLALFFLASER